MLSFHNPSLEPTGKRIALIQGCDPQSQSAYRNQIGRVEVVFMREWHPTDHGNGGYRWATWSGTKPGARLVEHFAIRADVGRNAGSLEFSSFRCEFDALGHNPSIDARQAERMCKTFKALERRVAELARGGNAVDFIMYARAVLGAFGITRMVSYANDICRGDLDKAHLFEDLPHTRAQMNWLNLIGRRIAGAGLVDADSQKQTA